MLTESLQITFVLVYAYLIGSVPLAYIVGRLVKGIDIRRYGSGNVGASNVMIHVGKWAVYPLSLFEIFIKGGSAIWIARYVFDLSPEIQAAAGLLPILGHSWSVFLGFTGGRGIAPAIGVLFAIAPTSPIELAAFILVGLSGWLVTRSAALWVGITTILLPIWSFLAMLTVDRDPVYIVLMGAIIATVATKRLISNPGTGAKNVPLKTQLLHRLLHDRDISSRQEWIHRKPS